MPDLEMAPDGTTSNSHRSSDRNIRRGCRNIPRDLPREPVQRGSGVCVPIVGAQGQRVQILGVEPRKSRNTRNRKTEARHPTASRNGCDTPLPETFTTTTPCTFRVFRVFRGCIPACVVGETATDERDAHTRKRAAFASARRTLPPWSRVAKSSKRSVEPLHCKPFQSAYRERISHSPIPSRPLMPAAHTTAPATRCNRRRPGSEICANL